MHSLGVAHLDIKPLNILLDERFNAKLADFGTAEIVDSLTIDSKNRCGTTGYMAPEFSRPGDRSSIDLFKADVYSLGKTLVTMIGESNLKPENDFSQQTQGSWTKSDSAQPADAECNSISKELKDLLGMMLCLDPEKRPSVFDLQYHCWVRDS
mmetsp:Transcript_30435/g.34850  ORF Transcript_30435/g.34850 Transcript_30435/m.34850 type:complete len:153 (+) Transcript_30435:391-849(+)